MKITFCGAARAVTGSCHLLEVNNKKILIDCGLQQGSGEFDNAVLPFSPAEIDYILVTHAHIDHSGRIPMMVKHGFKGEIICTRLTAELLGIMLHDSAYIQESDAKWENQKGKRSGKPPVEPLYTVADAMQAVSMLSVRDYNERFSLFEGVSVCFRDAGHLLGSSMIELWLNENGIEKKVVFSGDIGNKNQAIIRDPSRISEADYVVMESTYGNRSHEVYSEYTEGLAEIINETIGQGGNVIIPAFAVGRTQELLYYIREIKSLGLVKKAPDFPVYIDSPLAKEATQIFAGDLNGYIDNEASSLVNEGMAILSFPDLHLCHTVEESKSLNTDGIPKVIISASGMCDAGRIRHHLKHNLWRPECAVVFVGYQAEGSLGRILLDGAPKVKLFGEEIAVKAKLVKFQGLSSHADHDGLLDWINGFSPKPEHVFVVHGDPEVAPLFAEELQGLGFAAHAPEYTEEYDLIANRMLRAGITLVKKSAADNKTSDTYNHLLDAVSVLADLVRGKKNMSEKDQKHLTEQIKDIIKKWNK